MDRLRLSEGQEPYWQVEEMGRYEFLAPPLDGYDLYPFNYSGKTDPNGFYIGKDKYGSNIVVDFEMCIRDRATLLLPIWSRDCTLSWRLASPKT